MKTKILFLLCIFLISSVSFAQKDKKSSTKTITDIVGSTMGMGNVMGSLVNGINTSAFTGGKSEKKGLISQISGLKASDYLGYASVAGQLAGALKGASFLPDWANQKDGVLDKLQSAGSMADVAGGVSGLFGNLDPSVLSSGFKKNQSTWTTALSALSLLK